MYLGDAAGIIADFVVRKKYRPDPNIRIEEYKKLWGNDLLFEFLMDCKEADSTHKWLRLQYCSRKKILNYAEENREKGFYATILQYALRENDEIRIKKYYYHALCYNINAAEIVEKNLEYTDWNSLSSNPGAVHILKKNLDKVIWNRFAWVVNIKKEYPEYLYLFPEWFDPPDDEQISFRNAMIKKSQLARNRENAVEDSEKRAEVMKHYKNIINYM